MSLSWLWRFDGNLWHFLDSSIIIPVSAVTWHLPVCLCVYMFLLYRKIGHQPFGLGTHLLLYDLILTNYICNDLISKQGHHHRS